ncbi:MAG: pirin family protein [Myxococcales bacterium]
MANNESSGPLAFIQARARDLGGFTVRRILPSPRHRRVGPFVFLDHMGPTRFEPGHAIDVRPHPHINLATVTYLFEGEILHRDSLGYEQAIRPGAVNLMIAGSGIVHSERTTSEVKAEGQALHGIQLWLGLPSAREEDAPSFRHYAADSIPSRSQQGAKISVILGSAYGLSSPVQLPMETLYVAVELEPSASLTLPACEERAIYVVEGQVLTQGEPVAEGEMWVYRADTEAKVESAKGARFVIVGGAPLDGERHLFWNFVSSRPERIEQAKADWKERRFALVPGDSVEFIPLPE